MTIIVLAILGVIISMAVGSFWYSPKTPMGRLHMKSTGITDLPKEEQEKRMQEMKPQMWKYLVAQAFLALLTSLFIAFIMKEQAAFNLGSGVIYGEVFLIWLCFTIPMVGQSLLWGNCDKGLRWKKFFSDISENLVTYFVIVFVFNLVLVHSW